MITLTFISKHTVALQYATNWYLCIWQETRLFEVKCSPMNTWIMLALTGLYLLRLHVWTQKSAPFFFFLRPRFNPAGSTSFWQRWAEGPNLSNGSKACRRSGPAHEKMVCSVHPPFHPLAEPICPRRRNSRGAWWRQHRVHNTRVCFNAQTHRH